MIVKLQLKKLKIQIVVVYFSDQIMLNIRMLMSCKEVDIIKNKMKKSDQAVKIQVSQEAMPTRIVKLSGTLDEILPTIYKISEILETWIQPNLNGCFIRLIVPESQCGYLFGKFSDNGDIIMKGITESTGVAILISPELLPNSSGEHS